MKEIQIRAKDASIPVALIAEALIYDWSTGVLTWKHRPRWHFPSDREWRRWNVRHAGKQAGRTNDAHYRNVSLTIDGQRRMLKGHRIAWALTYGQWPDAEIDHINRVRGVNKINNLRQATYALNNQNASLRVDNKSGVAGVVQNKGGGKHWVARIDISNRRVHLGLFDKFEDAVAARLAAQAVLHPFRGAGQ